MDEDRLPSTEELLEAIWQIHERLDRLESTVQRLTSELPAREPPEPAAPEAPPPLPEPVVLRPATAEAAPAEAALPGLVAAAETPPQEPPSPEPAPPVPAEGPVEPPVSAEPPVATAVETPPEEPPAEGPEPVEPVEAPPSRPTTSLEQKLGARWMLFIGVGVLLLSGFFFFKYAIERQWISPTLRVLAGAAGGLVMIGVGEWAILRHRLRLFAAGVMGGGIVLLYFVVFLASPNGWYGLIGAPPAFALMCVVTVLGMALSLQTGLLSTSVVALIGAFATPVLLSTGENRQVFLMCYLLTVTAGFLSVGLVKGWVALGPLTLAGTSLVFGAWYAYHGADSPWQTTVLFGWLLLAEPMIFTCIAARRRRVREAWAQAFLVASGSVALVLWLVMFRGLPAVSFLSCIAGLAAVGLGLALWQGWRGLCWAAAGWSAVGLTWQAASWPNEQALLFGFLLAINAGLLAAALIRRWPEPAMLAVGHGVLVVAVWGICHYAPAAWWATTAFAWALLAECVLFACVGTWSRRLAEPWFPGVLFLTGSGALVLWLAISGDMPAVWLLSCVGGLAATGLVLSVLRGWRDLCLGAVAWSAVGLAWQAGVGADEQALLGDFLLAINAGVLAAALIRRWPEQALLALGQAALVVGVWCGTHYRPDAWPVTNTFAWLLLGELVLAGCAGVVLTRLTDGIAQTLIAGAGTAATLLWLHIMPDLPQSWFLGNLLALTVAALGIGLWRNWPVLSAAGFAWSAAGLAAHVLFRYDPGLGGAERWRLSVWVWVFFSAFSADALIRAFWRRRPMVEYLHAAVATLATAGMFGATYGLLYRDHADGLGVYAAGVGAGAVAAAWVVRRLADRRRLGYAYLGQGLVLLALAVPIHYDRAAVPIAWAVQGVVAMFLARRLRNVLLLLATPVVLGLAMIHFFAHSLPDDPRLAETLLEAFAAPITFGLVLAWGLVLALLAAAAVLRAGEALFDEESEQGLALAMTVAAAGVLAYRSAMELPVTGATWNWLLLGAGLAGVGLWRRAPSLCAVAGAVLLAAAGKWIGFDTLTFRLRYGAATAITPVLNWQCAAGVVTAAILLAHVAGLRRRVPLDPEVARALIGASVLAALMLVYAGSFEIDRYFSSGRVPWEDSTQAKQTAYSIWWAVYAVALMALGFIRASRMPRFLSLGLFAGTLVKVFLVDMARVETVYRILSFLCLGTLLVAASWLYHRFFREKPAA